MSNPVGKVTIQEIKGVTLISGICYFLEDFEVKDLVKGLLKDKIKTVVAIANIKEAR